MSSADADPIVRWEILQGLPGEVAPPRHFHVGNPRPWQEGFVVRFWHASGSDWVGNFQAGISRGAVLDWNEAGLILVFASGLLYLLNKNDLTYRFAASAVTGFLFDEQRTMLICARVGGRMVAYGRTGETLWSSDRLSVDVIELKSCVAGVISAEGDDYDGVSRHPIRISAATGACLE